MAQGYGDRKVSAFISFFRFLSLTASIHFFHRILPCIIMEISNLYSAANANEMLLTGQSMYLFVTPMSYSGFSFIDITFALYRSRYT